MTDRRYFHAVALPEGVIEQPRGRQSERVASSGALTSDVPAVESVSADAPGQVVAGVVGGKYGGLTATELEQLFGAGGIEIVPVFGDDGDPQRDGYYATEDIDTEQPAATAKDLQRFDGRLTKRGTRRSHRRAVKTNPETGIDNPFGSATTEEIGIPARATSVQWFDDTGGQTTEAATVQRTETGQHAAIDVFDATEPSFDKPALVYDVPYRDEWPVDVRVWDDYDRPRRTRLNDRGPTVGSATVGTDRIGNVDEVVTWQRVYRTDHDVVGSLVLENDVLQVVLDEESGRLKAGVWDETETQYDPVQLDISVDWRLTRADLRHIGVESVTVRLLFSDGSSDHRLDAELKRGYDDLLFVNAPNAGSAPADLVTRLDPIAHDSDHDPAGTADIIPRSEVGD